MDILRDLAPVSDAYASLPIGEAFDWPVAGGDLGTGEWYMVAFRSVRRAGADEARLSMYDEFAHQEAATAPGFVHYFKGPTHADGRCMSFCLWDSRAEARAASSRPAHMRAAAVTHEAYSDYTLEFHRVRHRAGEGFTFEPYDPVPGVRVARPRAPRALTPNLAPS